MFVYMQSLFREKIQPYCADYQEPVFFVETDTCSGEVSNQCQTSTAQSSGFIWQTQAPPPFSHRHLIRDLQIRSVTMTAHSQNALQLSKCNATLPLPFYRNRLFLPPL